MSQKEINKMIDDMFDDFVNSNGDINKMKTYKKENDADTNIVDNIYNLDENEHSELDEKSKNTYFNDGSIGLDFTDSLTGDLINNFLEYFKKIHNKPNQYTLFEGIDLNDPTSTNMALEQIFFELTTYSENMEKDPNLCKVIKFEDMDRSFTQNDELYAILINGNATYVSRSLWALLIEFTELKKANSKEHYEIVNLK